MNFIKSITDSGETVAALPEVGSTALQPSTKLPSVLGEC